MKRKAQCWIFSRDRSRVLKCLVLRTNAERGSFWQPVTGGVHRDEDFSDGALREAMEETGFVFEDLPRETGYKFRFTSKAGKDVEERVFFLFVSDVPTPSLDLSEHDDFRWLAPEVASKLLKFDSNRTGLESALEALDESQSHP